MVRVRIYAPQGAGRALSELLRELHSYDCQPVVVRSVEDPECRGEFCLALAPHQGPTEHATLIRRFTRCCLVSIGRVGAAYASIIPWAHMVLRDERLSDDLTVWAHSNGIRTKNPASA
jgi:hypothetical protein